MLSSEKNDIKITEIGWVVLILWSFLKTWSLSIFPSFLWYFRQGQWLFWLPYIVARKPTFTHWSVPAVNNSRRYKFWLFQEMVVESILLNQIKWSWYHSFRIQCFIWWNQCYIFSNIKVTRIKRSAFFGTPGKVVNNAIFRQKHVLYTNSSWMGIYSILLKRNNFRCHMKFFYQIQIILDVSLNIYTERQKKLITSSGRRSLKSMLYQN